MRQWARGLALGLGCLVLLSGCATAGGVRVEGAASQVKPPPSTPPPPSGVTPSFDPTTLLRADPKVSDKIKSLLTPCGDGRFPVDPRYVDVTGDGVAELLIEVKACNPKLVGRRAEDFEYTSAEGVVANYVFDVVAKPPVALFALEEPAIMFEIPEKKGGGLQMIHLEYRAGDRSCCPSQEVTRIYRWNGTTFELVKR
nr:SCE94.08, unknown, len: 202aa; previously sequenced therefore identical to TR:e1358526 (EMBL:AJ131213) hypothetical protein from Streptomyces coelicolor (202 aa) fasta scores; opt: 1347, z-score: 1386.9, E(): 0, (99.5 0dentity in 202 aa overlap). Note conflict in first codon, GTG rather than ATG [Kibdelosporangium sp. MJ126-NF4]